MRRRAAVVAQRLLFAHVHKQPACGRAAQQVHRHAQGADGGYVVGAARRKQHTQLGLRQPGQFFGIAAQRRAGHCHQCARLLRVALHTVQAVQQLFRHALGIGTLHHHVDAGLAQNAVVLGFQGFGRDGGQLVRVAAQLDARRGIAVKFAPRLPHAVQPLGVQLRLQAKGLGFGFDAHRLGVKDAVHKVRLKHGAENDIGVGVGQVFPCQRVGILDAADIRRQHAVYARAAQLHAQIGAVQPRQLAGQRGHIGAGGIAALQHLGQHGVQRGGVAPRGEAQVDGDAAAVEFIGFQRGDMYAGCQLFAFQS